MSAFSDEMAAVALDLIREFGEAITLSKATIGTYVPGTATVTGSTSASYTGYGVPTDYRTFEIDGSIIRTGDIRLYINALSAAPQTGDIVTLDSIDYRIVSLLKYTINSENVMYELQLRV